jgi:hypothetical protein
MFIAILQPNHKLSLVLKHEFKFGINAITLKVYCHEYNPRYYWRKLVYLN